MNSQNFPRSMDKAKKLAKLSRKNIRVLFLVCQGFANEDIVEILGLQDLSTISYHIGVINDVLEINPDRTLNTNQVRDKLIKEYSPLVNKYLKNLEDIKRWGLIRLQILEDSGVIPGEEELTYQEDQEDEEKTYQIPPKFDIPEPPEDFGVQETPSTRPIFSLWWERARNWFSEVDFGPVRQLLRNTLIGLGLISVGVIIGLLLIRPQMEGEPPETLQPTLPATQDDRRSPEAVAEITIEDTPTPDLIPTNTMTPTTPQPTPTPRPTSTNAPSSTPRPTPTETPVPQPFMDPFDNGASPDWQIFEGDNYAIIDGELSSEGFFKATVGDSTWTNYVFEFDLIYLSSWFEGLRIMMRRQDDSNYIFMRLWSPSYCYFSLNVVKNGELTTIPGTDERLGGNNVCRKNWRIEVSGNNYTIFRDFEQYQRITIDGYSSGGIGIFTNDEKSVFKLDNFQVEHLP